MLNYHFDVTLAIRTSILSMEEKHYNITLTQFQGLTMVQHVSSPIQRKEMFFQCSRLHLTAQHQMNKIHIPFNNKLDSILSSKINFFLHLTTWTYKFLKVTCNLTKFCIQQYCRIGLLPRICPHTAQSFRHCSTIEFQCTIVPSLELLEQFRISRSHASNIEAKFRLE